MSDSIQDLRREVEKVYAGRLSTSADFAKLSDEIFGRISQTLSESTLKRIWGYVKGTARPHSSSLDILAKYAGFISYHEFCRLQSSSEFFYCEKISSSNLNSGDRIVIGWKPDKTIKLEYEGNSLFRVLDGGSSKLIKGDIIENSHFIKGQPLFLGSVLRNGEELPAYVAGKAYGLDTLQILTQK